MAQWAYTRAIWILSIGAFCALSSGICLCAHLDSRLSTRLVASIVQEEVSIGTFSAASLAILCCAYSYTGGIHFADSINRDLRCCAALRAVLGAPNDGPAGLTAPCSGSGRALVHAGSIAGLVSSVYLRTFPAGQLRHLPAPAAVHEAHSGLHGLQALLSA